MKIVRLRFAIFCLILFCMVCVPITKPVFNVFAEPSITYYFYTSSINYQISGAKITSCGNGSIVSCNAEDSQKIKKILPYIYGESVRIKNYDNDTLKNIIQNYTKNLVKKEYIDDYNFMLCYDKSMPNFVTIDNQKVNVQIAISQNEINIGYPLILNGF